MTFGFLLAEVTTTVSRTIYVRQPSGPNWTDVGTFVVTALGVLTTVSAVVVALFGREWQERRSRPKLGLIVEDTGIGYAAEASSGDGQVPMEFRIRNADGRATALDVEVWVTSWHVREGGLMTVVVADEERLNFGDPSSSVSDAPVSTVPPGFSRRVNFAMVGPLHGGWAHLATTPSTGTKIAFEEGLAYEVVLIVTGSNFDAMTYEGQVQLKSHQEPDDAGGLLPAKMLEWKVQPRLVAPGSAVRLWSSPPGTVAQLA